MGKSKVSGRKIVVVGLLLAGVAAIGLRLYFEANKSRESKFMSTLKLDMEMMKKENQLHEGFENIKEVHVFSPSPELKKTYFESPLHLAQNQSGKYNLEIFLDEIEDGGVVVQYDLVELDSGNTVFEIARTIQLTSPE